MCTVVHMTVVHVTIVMEKCTPSGNEVPVASVAHVSSEIMSWSIDLQVFRPQDGSHSKGAVGVPARTAACGSCPAYSGPHGCHHWRCSLWRQGSFLLHLLRCGNKVDSSLSDEWPHARPAYYYIMSS